MESFRHWAACWFGYNWSSVVRLGFSRANGIWLALGNFYTFDLGFKISIGYFLWESNYCQSFQRQCFNFLLRNSGTIFALKVCKFANYLPEILIVHLFVSKSSSILNSRCQFFSTLISANLFSNSSGNSTTICFGNTSNIFWDFYEFWKNTSSYTLQARQSLPETV